MQHVTTQLARIEDALNSKPRGLSRNRIQEVQRIVELGGTPSAQQQREKNRPLSPLGATMTSATAGCTEADQMAHAVDFSEAPWWIRIVVDPTFRRQMSNIVSRRLRTNDEAYSKHSAPQSIVIASDMWLPRHPASMKLSLSAEQEKAAAATSNTLQTYAGLSYRWNTPFPPLGYVLVNDGDLKGKPSEGQLNINVYTTQPCPKEPTFQQLDLGETVRPPSCRKEWAVAGIRKPTTQELMEEDARWFRRQQGGNKTRIKTAALKQLLPWETTTDKGGDVEKPERPGGPPHHHVPHTKQLCYSFLGAVRPSFRLIRWKTMCNALEEYAHSKSCSVDPHVFLGSITSFPSVLSVESHPPVKATDATMPAASSLKIHPAEFATKAEKVQYVFPFGTYAPGTYFFPPSVLMQGLENPELHLQRLEFLRNSETCKASVRRLFTMIKKDINGRINNDEWISFCLDLVNLFLPSFHTQANIDLAEDEWMCRGSLEKADFNIFYQCFFDFPLTLCRGVGTVHMNEEQYRSFWDFVFVALHGRETYVRLAEHNRVNTFSKRAMQTAVLTGELTSGVQRPPDQPKGKDTETEPCDDNPVLPAFVVKYRVTIPTVRSTDDYGRYRVTEEVRSDPFILKQDPARQAHLIFMKVEERMLKESRMAKQHELTAKLMEADNRNRLSGTFADDLVSGDPAEEEFSSFNMQMKQHAIAVAKHAPLTQKQRAEAIRMQSLLQVENKSSALALYEATFRVEPTARDDMDDILDYCSDLSEDVFDAPASVRRRYDTQTSSFHEAQSFERRRSSVRETKALVAHSLQAPPPKISANQRLLQNVRKKKMSLFQKAGVSELLRSVRPSVVSTSSDAPGIVSPVKSEKSLSSADFSPSKSDGSFAASPSAVVDEAEETLPYGADPGTDATYALLTPRRKLYVNEVEELDADHAARVRQGERERVMKLAAAAGMRGRTGAHYSSNSSVSHGFATFQTLDRQAVVSATMRRGMPHSGELTHAGMHTAVTTTPFIGVSGALRSHLENPKQHQQHQAQQQQQQRGGPGKTGSPARPQTQQSAMSSNCDAASWIPYDFRAKAMREVPVDYIGSYANYAKPHTSPSASLHAQGGRVGESPPVGAAETSPRIENDDDSDEADGEDGPPPGRAQVPSYLGSIDDFVAEAGSKLTAADSAPAVVAPPAPSFMSRVNREKITPLNYPGVRGDAAPTDSAPPPPPATTVRGLSALTPRQVQRSADTNVRREWTKTVVPVRPPKYQVPQLKQLGPSDDVYVNGRVVTKPHKTLQMVRIINTANKPEQQRDVLIAPLKMPPVRLNWPNPVGDPK